MQTICNYSYIHMSERLVSLDDSVARPMSQLSQSPDCADGLTTFTVAPEKARIARLATPFSEISQEVIDPLFGSSQLVEESSLTGNWATSLKPGSIVGIHEFQGNIPQLNTDWFLQNERLGVVLEVQGHPLLFTVGRAARPDENRDPGVRYGVWDVKKFSNSANPLPEKYQALTALRDIWGEFNRAEGMQSLGTVFSMRGDIPMDEAMAHLSHGVHDMKNQFQAVKSLTANPILGDLLANLEPLDIRLFPAGYTRAIRVKQLQFAGTSLQAELEATGLATIQDEHILSPSGEVIGAPENLMKALSMRRMANEAAHNLRHRMDSHKPDDYRVERVFDGMQETLVAIGTNANNHMTAGEVQDYLTQSLLSTKKKRR